MFERGTAVEAETGNTGNREFDRQHITRLAGWIVTGCTVDGAHRAVGEYLGVETGSSLGVLVVPEANRVLSHCESFRFQITPRSHPLPVEIGSPVDVLQPGCDDGFCSVDAEASHRRPMPCQSAVIGRIIQKGKG